MRGTRSRELAAARVAVSAGRTWALDTGQTQIQSHTIRALGWPNSGAVADGSSSGFEKLLRSERLRDAAERLFRH